MPWSEPAAHGWQQQHKQRMQASRPLHSDTPAHAAASLCADLFSTCTCRLHAEVNPRHWATGALLPEVDMSVHIELQGDVAAVGWVVGPCHVLPCGSPRISIDDDVLCQV